MVVMMMVPAMPAVMTMEAVVVTMVSPMSFRRLRPCVLLDRRRGTGIAERQRAGALDRSGENEQRGNGRKSQNFRYLHVQSPRSPGCQVRAEWLVINQTASLRHVHMLTRAA